MITWKSTFCYYWLSSSSPSSNPPIQKVPTKSSEFAFGLWLSQHYFSYLLSLSALSQLFSSLHILSPFSQHSLSILSFLSQLSSIYLSSLSFFSFLSAFYQVYLGSLSVSLNTFRGGWNQVVLTWNQLVPPWNWIVPTWLQCGSNTNSAWNIRKIISHSHSQYCYRALAISKSTKNDTLEMVGTN